jgi:hypothetical protein
MSRRTKQPPRQGRATVPVVVLLDVCDAAGELVDSVVTRCEVEKGQRSCEVTFSSIQVDERGPLSITCELPTEVPPDHAIVIQQTVRRSPEKVAPFKRDERGQVVESYSYAPSAPHQLDPDRPTYVAVIPVERSGSQESA